MGFDWEMLRPLAGLAMLPLPLLVWELLRYRRAAWLPWAALAQAIVLTAWTGWLGGPLGVAAGLFWGALLLYGVMLPDPVTWLRDQERRRVAYAALEAARMGGWFTQGLPVCPPRSHLVGRCEAGWLVLVTREPDGSRWLLVPHGPGEVAELPGEVIDPKKHPCLAGLEVE